VLTSNTSWLASFTWQDFLDRGVVIDTSALPNVPARRNTRVAVEKTRLTSSVRPGPGGRIKTVARTAILLAKAFISQSDLFGGYLIYLTKTSNENRCRQSI